MTEEKRASDSGPSFRHSAREVALQALYALDLQRVRAAARASAEVEASGVTAEAGGGALALEHEAGVPDVEDARTAPEVFEAVAEHFEMPAAARDFALQLVTEVSERGEKLDALVTRHARNWRLSRMATVDRNILRLASFELGHTATPTPIVLDEAVELARRFGSDASPAFVNGVLDSIARDLRAGEGSAGRRGRGKGGAV
jgi:N utilization substance protein B